ncbi:3-beta hydroxysteroid dehydrogenase, partial [Phenylobacterium hankyongense]
FGKLKAFPFRDQHFFASVEKAKRELGLTPEFDLVEGLRDSYELDFGRGTYRKAADFTTDDMILSKTFALQQ